MNSRELPVHLRIAPDRGDDRLQCRVCRKLVTVGTEGTEFGHQRHARGRQGDEWDARCPHRPNGVDPSGGSATATGRGPDAARDEAGKYAPEGSA